jgi:hypothetical protein
MALCAVSPHLPAMNVGVAVGTVRSGIREHRLGMTLGTRHSLVQAAKRIFRCVVIELWNRADGLPARGCMAVLARDIQVAMRASRDRRTSRLPKSCAHPEAGRSQDKEGPRECALMDHALCVPRLNPGCTSGAKESSPSEP